MKTIKPLFKPLHKSKVTTADVKSSNGVIHNVDLVLLPPADK